MSQDPSARRGIVRGAAAALALLATTASAAPDAATLVNQMKQALEPPKASVRKMTLTVTQQGATSTVVLGQARGKLAEGNRILTVVLAPPDLRGTAYLVGEQAASDDNVQWAYVPAIGRVRTVVSPEAFSAFLNSDFTYFDLGFTPLRSSYKVLDGDGGKGTRIEAIPPQRWYYTRILTAIAPDTFLPVERQFYDPANQLWKVERFQGVATVDGIPTILTDDMEDVQAKSRSTLKVTDLKYGADIPQALLQPGGLPDAAKSPLWTSLNAPVGK
jgi:hypothetical protein